jgi:hypothetical protein
VNHGGTSTTQPAQRGSYTPHYSFTPPQYYAVCPPRLPGRQGTRQPRRPRRTGRPPAEEMVLKPADRRRLRPVANRLI